MSESERRKRCHQVHVRLSPAEFLELSGRVGAWNGRLPADASPNAKMTIPRILVASALKSDIPRIVPGPVVPRLTDEQQAELRTLRAATASLGNLFRAWIKQGAGVYRGKGGQDIKVTIGPTPRQIRDGDELLRALKDAHKRISAIIG
jgi:hypothetical protein